jgi:OFA family oxalate/formate antiporter-like MFS transporter
LGDLKVRKPFYGWIIVGVAFLIGATEAGAFQNILSVFLKPMAGEFGWSRTIVTGAIALGSICGGIISPFVGPILDRHGPRMVAFWGILILSAGLVSLSFLEHIWELYLFFGIGRMIAVGALSLVISVTVSNWFIRRRGRAIGIAWLGARFGSIILPPFVQFLIFAQGWRMAWAALGGLIFLLSGIPSLIFLRRRPEDVGLFPDGEPPAVEVSEDAVPAKEESSDSVGAIPEPVWTRAQALRTPNFWVLTLLNSIIPFTQGGINFHMFPFLTDQGFTETAAVLILSTIAIFGALGSVVWGVFAEWFRTQLLIAINVFINCSVIVAIFWFVKAGFPSITGALGIVVIIILIGFHGITSGGRMPLISIIWAEFFGRASLGSIYSFSSPFRFTANALGPIFAALCFDLLGSYTLPFHIFSILFLLSGILCFFMKPPKHPVSVNEGA